MYYSFQKNKLTNNGKRIEFSVEKNISRFSIQVSDTQLSKVTGVKTLWKINLTLKF